MSGHLRDSSLAWDLAVFQEDTLAWPMVLKQPGMVLLEQPGVVLLKIHGVVLLEQHGKVLLKLH